MKEELVRILRLRFDERNRRMIERFTDEKQQLNARGLLNSSETLRAMHKVLKAELKESAGTVVTTILDVMTKQNVLVAKKHLQDWSVDALAKRKDEIEAQYLSEVRHIEQGLQNKAMLQSLMSLGEFYAVQREEMLIELSNAWEKYSRDRGGNLASVIKNRFLNHPTVAWASIVMAAILLIAAFAGAIRGLQGVFG